MVLANHITTKPPAAYSNQPPGATIKKGKKPLRNLETVQVEADKIREHPQNPRKGDVEAIKQSMQANGIYRPVIVQKSSGYILAGNHTYRAMRELGETRIPVVFVDVDDDTATRILLADNRTADLGEYDHETLIQLLQDIPDLDGTGYDPQDLENLLRLQPETSLDNLLDEYPPVDDDGMRTIAIKAPVPVFEKWTDYLEKHDFEPAEGLSHLLTARN